MPPPPKNTSDLSTEHLPDASNDSISFQISRVLSNAELLLCNDDMSFFRDQQSVYPGLASPDQPMTTFILDDMTPRRINVASTPQERTKPSTSLRSFDVSPKSPSRDVRPAQTGQTAPRTALPSEKQKPSLKLVTSSTQAYVGPVEPAFTAKLPEGVEALDDAPLTNTTLPGGRVKRLHTDAAGSMDIKNNRIIAKPKRTVISGGISKNRSKITKSSAHNKIQVPRTQKRPQATELPENAGFRSFEGDSDESIKLTAACGVAARLVMYNQSLPKPCSIPSSENNTSDSNIDPGISKESHKGIPDYVAVNQRDHDTPLTLSQLSPAKRSSSPPQSEDVMLPSSPMRHATKRPISATSAEPSIKKGRGEGGPGTTHLITNITNETRVHKESSSFTLTRNVHPSGRVRGPKKPPKRRAPLASGTSFQNGRAKGGTLVGPDHPGASCSSAGSSSLNISRPDSHASSGSSVNSREEMRSLQNDNANNPPCIIQHAMLRRVNPTIPVAFTFQTDARIEASKPEQEKGTYVASQKPRNKIHQVPDFKALHALQEAEIAHRKENIMPIAPIPLELSTEGRAREREKFQEHLRQKEREQELAMEQRRKEQEETEAREIKELRKKTIPRAHEVPEWYREAPKKKKEVDAK